MTVAAFRLHFAGFISAAALCALMALSIISFACQSARAVTVAIKAQRFGQETGSRPQDGLSQPVDTAPHTAGKPVDLLPQGAGVAAGSPGSLRSSSLLRIPERDGGRVMASAEGNLNSTRVPVVWQGSRPRTGSANVSEGVTPRRDAELYEVTAYSHGCILPRSGQEGHARRAANGRWPIADVTVAADTSIHPFGSELLIKWLGFRTVGDRGHAIKGRRLDLFVDSCREARRFGRQWLAVVVVPAEATRLAAR